jgi:hypothetical protein
VVILLIANYINAAVNFILVVFILRQANTINANGTGGIKNVGKPTPTFQKNRPEANDIIKWKKG